MYQQSYSNEMPGVGGSVLNVNKAVWKAREGVRYLPGGGTINAALSRDPANTLTAANYPAIANLATSYTGILQAGLLMGKITATGLYRPSILGLSTAAVVDSGNPTTITVSAATATEVERLRQLGGGTVALKLIGPATDAAAGAIVSTSFTCTATTVNGASSSLTSGDLSVDKVTASLITPADGAEVPVTLIDTEDGIRVTNGDGTSLTGNAQFPHIPVSGGMAYTANIVGYSSLGAALKAWIKSELRLAGGVWLFDDDF